ncbi:zinc finger protein 91-like isoform X2 [Venturia canescens]|uniref:zinc finger protein 91-like isoform X2 n=1 Tax=Venturia canescens TaxID=32260 RepID=UPI001C9C7954|nr:zinc finger protein 91-like isoform X2 [Venturia canescens]
MFERSPRLRGLRPRTQQRSPQAPDYKNEMSEINEPGDSVNRSTEDQDRDADTSETLSDDELHIAIRDEQDEPVSDEKSEVDKNYECKTCKTPVGFPTLVEYLQHLRDEHKEKGRSYDCPHCDFVCQHPKSLQEHYNSEHKNVDADAPASEEPTSNQCTMCPYAATNATELETHQRVHHLKRRFFRCTKCTYMTHVRARYTKHVKYHSMPMIKCDDCDFRTPYKWNLDRHTRNHGGGGAFQCRACSFTADIRQSLTVHETNHHEPPVGEAHRRMNTSFDRRLRTGPKRYNQVGASDFRKNDQTEGPATLTDESPGKSPSSDIDGNSIEDRRNAIAGAECIALKCEEKGCQFITAWDSEMQRHLAESHAPSLSPIKRRKPMPMLIPLSPDSDSSAKKTVTNGPRTTPLKVPRVRVRPELARIARDTEIAKLYNNRESGGGGKKETGAADLFEKRNASFFDKLKERLMTTSASITGVSQVAVSSQNDLKCWCTYKASSQEELASHSQTHHTALSVSVGISRCPKCRRRCKSSNDLQMHMNICQTTSNDLTTVDSCLESPANSTNYEAQSYGGDFEFPFQVDWDGSFGGLNSSGSSVEGHTIGRRVFKCPHCPFWASTASRFHVHIVGHLNRKPFECSLCAYRSNWRWDITKHIKLKTARDPAHLTARVLMTDETGRRNYSKYNKYLAQGTEEIGLEEGVAGEAQIDEPPKKVLITGENHDFSGPPELTPAPGVAENIETNSMSILTALNLRPPPPLKSASRSQGQSLLKTNPSATNAVSILSNNPLSSITNVNSQEEAKRTLWKCKRCNFRSSHKETVLTHVKTHYESTEEATEEGEKNEFTCPDCPYISNDPTAMAIHRIHHRPNLEAIFKCYLCPYYVSTKKELLEHSSLHGEELAVVHQRSIESFSVGSKRKMAQGQSKDNENSSKSELAIEEIINSPTSASSTENSSSVTVNKNNPTSNNKNNGSNENANMSAPPLMLDTRALPDTPLVWVSRTDGTLAKMLKCRHCPYVSSRRVEVRDHETMHVNSSSAGGTLVACPDCSFSCSRRDVMEVHAEMHTGSLGTVHCLVDDGRTDAEQLEDLATLLGLARAPVLGPDPDLRDSRLVYCCSKCPARFLCDKELRIHLRYHSTELAYSCEWCSYAARQPAHLLAHQKAHSSEYQEHTRYLLSMYGNSQRYAPPNTACVESTDTRTRESMDKDSKNEGNRSKVAWIVVDNTTNTISNGSQNYSTNITENSESRGGHQVFTCAKCPARYFKLDALEYHMTLHGSNNCFKCTECDYSSKTAQNLMKHQVVHRRHGESSEPSANRSQQEQAQQRSQGGQQEQDLLDPQLGVAIRGNPNFVYPGSLRNGRIKEKRYKCHKCPSAFEKREQYRVHLTLHGAKQRYRCDKCDYSVKYYANYAQHVKKHQANAQAQAGKRQGESESISVNAEGLVNSDTPENRKTSKNRRKSTISSAPAIQNVKNGISASTSVGLLQPSNQDKQSVLLMKKKGACTSSVEDTSKMLRCLDCPFSSSDKDAMDSHKRRHGIERLTPPCPHCNYVPRKDENVGEHIRLHFTRLYKPESYLIVELLTLTMRPLLDDKKDSKIRNNDILFRECKDGKYLPTTENNLLPPSGSSSVNGYQEKVIVDPNTGETKHRYST